MLLLALDRGLERNLMPSRHNPQWNTHLLVALVKRDFKAQYRRSFVGPAWAVLHAIIYLSLFTLIRSFLNIPSDGKPYVAFAASAIVPWTFFTGAVGRASGSILQNGSLLKKMAVRREIFPVAGVVLSLVDLAITSSIVLGLIAWFGLPVGMSLILLPILIAMLIACALGFGMVVAALGVYKRDILFGLPFVLQIWMFLSPIIYPVSVVPEKWRALYSLNPLVGIVEGFRAILLSGTMPDWQLMVPAALSSALIFLIGWAMFRVFSQYFVDVL